MEGTGQGTQYNNSDYGVNDDGERIVLATRRADGTYRKERRVRAGYVPPDEQAAYVSKGRQWRLEAEKDPVPGLDPTEVILPASKTTGNSLSKSAKKNAARKAKKDAKPHDSTGNSFPKTGVSPDKCQENNGNIAAQNDAEPSEASQEKKLRTIKKKIRQCEQLQEKQEAGDELTSEQVVKLGTLDDLRKQLQEVSLEDNNES